MSTNTNLIRNSRFKSGSIVLLVPAALMVLGHFSMIFFQGGDETTLFIGLTVFNLYAFLVIYIPFRRGEKWAWVAAWLLPIGLALLAFHVPAIAIYYYAFVSRMCVGIASYDAGLLSKR